MRHRQLLSCSSSVSAWVLLNRTRLGDIGGLLNQDFHTKGAIEIPSFFATGKLNVIQRLQSSSVKPQQNIYSASAASVMGAFPDPPKSPQNAQGVTRGWGSGQWHFCFYLDEMSPDSRPPGLWHPLGGFIPLLQSLHVIPKGQCCVFPAATRATHGKTGLRHSPGGERISFRALSVV